MPPKRNSRKAIDITWNHCVRVNEQVEEGGVDNTRLRLRCNYCGNEYSGGVIRMKHHLARTRKNVAVCTKCPDEVVKIFSDLLQGLKQRNNIDDDIVECFDSYEELDGKSIGGMDKFVSKGKGKQITLTSMVKDRTKPCLDICRFLYANALPFHLVKSPWFHTMIQSIVEYGKGLKPPTYHEVRVPFLKKEVDNVNATLGKYKSEWKKAGCTLMSDGWQDGKGRSITNFLVNSPMGTIFLKSVDTSSIIKDAHNLFELLDSMVEEIGEENVVQVVTDSASAYVLAGEMLMEKRKKLFWSPCAAHCIDLMLKDIGDLPVHSDTISKARVVTVFIYRHSWVLNLMRKFTKNHELARPAVARFATSYLTLRSMLTQKIGLRAMSASEEWAKSSHSKKSNGIKAQEIVLDSKFWQAIKYCLKSVLPLVKVLRLVDGDAKLVMGYIYEAMDRAKEQIEKNFNFVKRRYDPIWKIIDERWALQLHRPLHAAGYYFNPRFHYGPTFDETDMEVKLGLYKTLERMHPDIETRIKLDAQMDKFHQAIGMFGLDTAIITRDRKQPALWWEIFGSSCKELQRLAIRILSLTCSATGCERNWSTFQHIHSKKRNRLEQQRLNALVFVKYNLNLEMRQKKRAESGETYDPICLSDMESDDEWITERENSCLPQDNSWMDINECFEVNEGETSKKRKRGPKNLQHDRKGKGKAIEEEIEVIEDDDEEEEDDECIDDDGMVVGDDGDDDLIEIDLMDEEDI